MSLNKDLETMTHLAEEGVHLAVVGQQAAMAVLLAEMQALSHILPGQAAAHPPEDARAAEKRARAEEALFEEAFDNMPV
jgi:hypothetical protein